MCPTVFRQAGFRFFFISREEPRMHVHVQHASGEVKLWIEPRIEVAQNWGLRQQQLSRVKHLVEEHIDEIRAAWEDHFPS